MYVLAEARLWLIFLVGFEKVDELELAHMEAFSDFV